MPGRPTPDVIADAVRIALRAQVDETYKAGIQRLVPGARAMGVRVPAIRTIAADVAKQHPDADTLIALLDLQCKTGVREEILVGTLALAKKRSTIAALRWKHIANWLPAIDNWETCDQLATSVVAPMVAAQPDLLKELHKLAGSPDLWERRLILAAGAALNQKGRSMADATVRLCELLVDEREPMVCKAMGWALREATDTNAVAVFAFLKKYAARLAPTVVREGSEKLEPAQRKAVMALRKV